MEYVTRRCPPDQVVTMVEPIDEDELKDAIFHAPKKKSPGIDDLPNEVYICFSDALKSDQLLLYNSLLDPDGAGWLSGSGGSNPSPAI